MTFKEFSSLDGNVLLSIDTSSAQGGISIFEDQKLLGESLWDQNKPHSETLTEEYQTLLNKLCLSPNSIKDVICAQGPGSFTGLRVGLNFAKSICYVNKIQLTLGYSFRSYIDLKALKKHDTHKTLVLINAFKNQVFACDYMFISKELIENPTLVTLTPEEVCEKYRSEKSLFILGDGFETYLGSFSEEFKQKSTLINDEKFNPATRLAELFFQYDQCLKFTKIDPLQAEPLYIKKSEAEENLDKGRLKKHSQRKL